MPSPLASHWTLDPTITFLNHGSFGACPRVVQEVQAELRARLEAEPVRFFIRELPALWEAAREAMAALVGASPRDLAFVNNATTGVNTALASFPLGPGDQVLITDHGYNACNNAARRWAELRGAEVVVAALPLPCPGPDAVVDAVLAAVTPRTKLAVLDHVTSPTGLVLPVERLVPALAARGVEAVVDGAHALGMLPLDLDRLGAAYYTANAHKWLCAPKGAAILHVRRDLQDSLRPVVTSHGANAPEDGRPRFQVELDWVGTTDPTAVLALPAALAFMQGILPGGLPSAMAANRALVLEGRQLLVDAFGVEPAGPSEMLGSLATVILDEAPEPGAFGMDRVHHALFARGLELPVMRFQRWRLLRISAQVYNAPQDYRRLVAALREVWRATS
ncbi:MAG: aminotransferase class V-fold PLP-dependent enzyme [Myxococcales bacterium]|nr:aminotransferase class V-fold PLP-dependent enzyme [Myxococcales bacterium]